jgi:hypothetical protein
MSKAVFSLENKRVWVAGHRGMVGSALVRRLERENCEIVMPDRSRLDLRNQFQVETWITETKPNVILSPLRKWVAYWPMTPIQPTSCTTIDDLN